MTPMETLAPRQPGCRSDLEWEQLLLGAGQHQLHLDPHLTSCASCRARLEWLASAGEEFRSLVLPRTRSSVLDRLRTPPGLPWWRWVAVPTVALAAGLALFIVTGPSRGYVGTKGSPAAGQQGSLLEVYVGEHGHGRRLSDGEPVRADDGLRFVVRAPGRAVFLISVDSTGAISRLFPAATEGLVPSDGVLPTGAIVDAAPGPERIFAVYPDEPMGFEELEGAVRQALGTPGSEAVRRLLKLPISAAQESLLLEKAPR